tara:strand:- start:255 stop:383 length:129 start_codon:yes stop_codon:yes gene_type:complete
MPVIDSQAWTADNLNGRRLAARNFSDVVGKKPTLLIFLRHLG